MAVYFLAMKIFCLFTHDSTQYFIKNMKEEDISEFKRGALSAIAGISITYPLNKLSIRQSMEGVTANKAITSLRMEGVGSLYRGIGPPLLQKTAGISMMFGIFQIYRNIYSSMFPNLSEKIIYIMAGTTSGVIESVLTPFERVQTLLTCPRHAIALNNMISGSHYMLRYFPLKEFYRGWTAVVFRNCLSTSLFFILRDTINNQIEPGKYEHAKNFFTGGVLGSILTTICFPLNATRIYMQGELGVPYKNFSKSFIKLLELRGSIRKVYIGAGMNALRSIISWGIINTTYEYLVFF
ncbi:hypothetical protein HZS_3197 [Henneguya salminicola]|nr:hypothetical protein HZS_3197 [Henneguya salminicola]